MSIDRLPVLTVGSAGCDILNRDRSRKRGRRFIFISRSGKSCREAVHA
jgi:hypothetical protein